MIARLRIVDRDGRRAADFLERLQSARACIDEHAGMVYSRALVDDGCLLLYETPLGEVLVPEEKSAFVSRILDERGLRMDRPDIDAAAQAR